MRPSNLEHELCWQKPLDIELSVKAQLDLQVRERKSKRRNMSDISNNSVPIKGWASTSCPLKLELKAGQGKKLGMPEEYGMM